MTTTTAIPGTEHVFADSTSGFTYSLPSPTVVGSGAVTSDGSDATYYDLGFSWGHPGGADLGSSNRLYVQLAAADLTATGLTVNFRTNETTSGTGLSLPDVSFAFVDKGPGFTEDDFFASMAWSVRPSVTENSDFTDYTADLTVPFSHFGCTLDDVLALIAAGNCWVQIAADAAGRVNAPGFDGLVEIHLSEFSVSMPNPTSFAPPLRLTNRDDMFASARRLTGGSSRQGSNRLTGYL